MPWWGFAIVSALAASATAILAKVGIAGVPSNLATAIRTAFVLLFSIGVVVALGEHHALKEVKSKAIIFLALSAVGTAVSWLAYFRALQMAPASRVAPIDKMSLGVTVVLAMLVLGEPFSWKVALGAALIIAGALLTLTA